MTRVKMQRGIKTWGLNFIVESRPGVTIQRGVQILSVGGVVIQWPPVSGGRNSTWKIRWILITARWIKTPRVEIQWGQNSILHLPLRPRSNSVTVNKKWKYTLCVNEKRVTERRFFVPLAFGETFFPWLPCGLCRLCILPELWYFLYRRCRRQPALSKGYRLSE